MSHEDPTGSERRTSGQASTIASLGRPSVGPIGTHVPHQLAVHRRRQTPGPLLSGCSHLRGSRLLGSVRPANRLRS